MQTTIIRRRFNPRFGFRGRFNNRIVRRTPVYGRPYRRPIINQRIINYRARPFIRRFPNRFNTTTRNNNRPNNRFVQSRTFTNSNLKNNSAAKMNANNIGTASKPVIPKATLLTNDMPYATRGSKQATAAAVANDPFYQCRLSPFTAPGMGMIPDASESRKVMVDHRMMHTFTFGTSGTAMLVVCPVLPSSIWARDAQSPGLTGNLKLDGVEITTLNNEFAVLNQPEWLNQGITYYDLESDYNEVQLLYEAGECRFVSVGWSITPITAAINTSGLIRITPINFNFQPAVPSVGKVVVNSWDDNTVTEYNNNQVMITLHNNINGYVTGMNKDTRAFPFSTGAHGILKHNGEEYNFRTINNQHVLPVNIGATPSHLANEQYSTINYEKQAPSTIRTGAAMSAWDNDWNATLIVITGGTPGQSFVFDSIYCVEYVPNPSGNVYALANPSPPSKPIVLKTTRDTANAEPIAKAGGLSTIVSAVSTIGSIGAQIASSFA